MFEASLNPSTLTHSILVQKNCANWLELQLQVWMNSFGNRQIKWLFIFQRQIPFNIKIMIELTISFWLWTKYNFVRFIIENRFPVRSKSFEFGRKIKSRSLLWENYISISFQIEWDMIVITVFLSILNQMEFSLVQNRKENCHHDHMPFNFKVKNVFSVRV